MSPLKRGAQNRGLKTKAKKDLALEGRTAELAEKVVRLHYRRRPELARRYGPHGRVRCLEDAVFHIDFLLQAVSARDAEIFLEYVLWAKAVLVYRGIPVEDFAMNLECLLQVIRTSLPAKTQRLPAAYIKQALRELPQMPAELPSFIDNSQPHAPLANEYLQLLLLHDRQKAAELIRRALKSEMPIAHIYEHIFTPAQREVGRLWQQNKITVAQEHYCTAATEVIMAQVFAQVLGRPGREMRLLAFCVEGEQHCLGVHMFSELMELNGWAVLYLGANTPISGVVQMAKKYEPHVVAISATMAFNLRKVERVINALRESDANRSVKILVGGHAFEQDSGAWKRIQADGFAPDLIHGLETADGLIAR